MNSFELAVNNDYCFFRTNYFSIYYMLVIYACVICRVAEVWTDLTRSLIHIQPNDELAMPVSYPNLIQHAVFGR